MVVDTVGVDIDYNTENGICVRTSYTDGRGPLIVT